MLQNLKIDKSAMQEPTDRVGLLSTGLYTNCVIKYAYIIDAESGAKGVVIKFDVITDADTGAKRELTQTLWVSNKDGQTFYIDQRTNKPHNLMGFNMANHICALGAGKSLIEMDTEVKNIPIYDFDTKKEVLKPMPVLHELTGCSVALAIARVKQNKQVKNPQTGKYEPTDEPQELNQIEKVFSMKTGTPLTYDESFKGSQEGTFAVNWATKFTDTIIDKFKPVTVVSNKGSAAKRLGGIN